MKKHGNAGPVPPGNQPHFGPNAVQRPDDEPEANMEGGDPASDQDEKRRFGDYARAGDAPIMQPGGAHDADRKPGMKRGSGSTTPKPNKRRSQD